MIAGVGLGWRARALVLLAACAGCYSNNHGDHSINPLAAVAPVYYEKYEVRGLVTTDDASGRPLAGARVVVRLRDGTQVAEGISDAQGRFVTPASRSRGRTRQAGTWSDIVVSIGFFTSTRTTLVEHNVLAAQHPHYEVDVHVTIPGYRPDHRRVRVPVAVKSRPVPFVLRSLGPDLDDTYPVPPLPADLPAALIPVR